MILLAFPCLDKASRINTFIKGKLLESTHCTATDHLPWEFFEMDNVTGCIVSSPVESLHCINATLSRNRTFADLIKSRWLRRLLSITTVFFSRGDLVIGTDAVRTRGC